MSMLPRAVHRIQRLACRPLQPVTIQQLLARSASASDADHVQYARWCHDEFPVRLAHRLSDFLRLPYVVLCNSRFHEVFRLFLHSFESLADSDDIHDLDSADKFAQTLRGCVRGHDRIVHLLQEGYGELQALLDGGLIDLDGFLNQTFFTRIGNRVLAEQFLAVHEARKHGNFNGCRGVVTPDCCPAEIVLDLSRSLGSLCSELYGVEPKVVLEGELETQLSFVHEHLTFMLQEIIKNAFRATIESHLKAGGLPEHLPVVAVEIMKGSFDVTLKVSDCGGGMTKEKYAKIWKYGYTSTAESTPGFDREGSGLFSDLMGQDQASLRQIAGYGFGLPLSRVYAQYFGGDIHVQTMHGYGTDVYLNINHLGDMNNEESGARLVAS